MATTLTTLEVQTWLGIFGYYDGSLDGDPNNARYKAALEEFQGDYETKAGNPDGIYGPNTESALLPLVEQAKASGGWPDAETPKPPLPTDRPPPIEDVGQLRRWQLTEYWISTAVAGDIPMLSPSGEVLETMSPNSYVSGSLEGTIYGTDGRVINTASGWINVDADTYQPVYEIAARNGWLPDKAGYAGIQVADGKVTKAMTFEVVKTGPNGWPYWKGIEASPFRTMAADVGTVGKSDPTYKGKGGVIPVGTWVFVLELSKLVLPDGTTHDGWVRVNDQGSAIYGAHLDLFVGPKSNNTFSIPNLGDGERCHIWFDGIDKLAIDYDYGLD